MRNRVYSRLQKRQSCSWLSC
ncbi:hypothetical protein LINGRAPRIM_LOCUS2008 [Linum grandiflorum]